MQPPPTPPARRANPWVMAVLVSGMVLACYWPALRGGMLWDDNAHVTRPELRSLEGLGRIWTDMRATQQYYPVLHSAFWLEHRLWGDAVPGYHLLNAGLHALACGLLAFVLRRLWKNSAVPAGAEWLAAALFAVHPVCVESVAWISEQKNTLSLCFYLLAALAYLDFDAGRKPSAYVRASLFFLLALGTKSVTATLPAALLVVLWWRHGRLDGRRDVGPLVPWLLAGAAAGLFTAWVERAIIGAEGAVYDLSLLQRLLLAGRVTWFYLGKLVWPFDLMFVYPRWDVAAESSRWIGGLVALGAITAGLWWLRRRSRGPLAGWLFFLGSLFPALGFFNVYPFVYSYVADHFQYLACLGLIAVAAAGLARLAANAMGRALLILLTGGLAVLSNRQSAIYRDEETLYRATLRQNPAAWMAHNNLANLLVRQPGGASEALTHYDEALRLRPSHYNAHLNLANLLARMPGRHAEALTHYAEALRLKPDYAVAHASLAKLLARWPGRLDEALAHYTEALRLAPDYAEAHNDLGLELAVLPGRQAEALAHYTAALRLKPDLAEAHNNLGILLATMPGREAEARTHYEEALRLKPGLAAVHHNLAVVLLQQGRLKEAIAHCVRALEIDPDLAPARQTLAYLQSLPGK